MEIILISGEQESFKMSKALPQGPCYRIGYPEELQGYREYKAISDGSSRVIKVPKLEQHPGSCGPAWVFCAADGSPLPVFKNEYYYAPEIVAVRASAGDVWIRIERYSIGERKGVAIIKEQTLYCGEAAIRKWRCNHCGAMLGSFEVVYHECAIRDGKGRLLDESLTIAEIPLPGKVMPYQQAVMAAQTIAESGLYRGYEDMF